MTYPIGWLTTLLYLGFSNFSIKLMINLIEDLNGFIMKLLNVFLHLLYVDSWIILNQIFSGNCFSNFIFTMLSLRVLQKLLVFMCNLPSMYIHIFFYYRWTMYFNFFFPQHKSYDNVAWDSSHSCHLTNIYGLVEIQVYHYSKSWHDSHFY